MSMQLQRVEQLDSSVEQEEFGLNKSSRVDACPVCGSDNLLDFLNRTNVPVHQNLLMNSETEARDVTRGDLQMACCDTCGFVLNRSFDETRLSYGEDYDNDQMHSSGFKSHIDYVIHTLVNDHQVKGCHVVEVGCGQGQIISRLVKEGKNTGTGFDPSYVGELSLMSGDLNFQQRFYDASCSDISADVVISRHVIEHVPEPLKMLKSIRKALGDSRNARVFFETPCVEWILENQVVWDFFYEHCSLFTANSITTLFELAGFKVDKVSHVFGGQYLWLEATIGENVEAVKTNNNNTLVLADHFGKEEVEQVENWKNSIVNLKKNGKNVAVWGAGAKGTTFVNLVDPDGELIDCLIDINPNKQNKFVAGSGHPIVDYQEISSRAITDIVLMNPNYKEEINNLLNELNITINLIEQPFSGISQYSDPL